MKSFWLGRSLPALIVCVGMLPSAWLLLKFRDTPQLGFLMDDVMYIGAAQSLADTGTYRQPALPGDHWQTKYPPGYPLLLAAILKINPAARDGWIVLHSWLWLFASAIVLAWAMTETGLSRLQAAAVAAMWAANPSASLVGTSALSEAPFCALLFAAIGLAQRANRTGIAAVAAVSGILLGLASVTRTAGIIAAAAIFIWLLWNRRFLAAIWFAACSAMLPAMWLHWSQAHLSAAGDYVTSFYFNYSGAWLHTLRAVGLRAIVPRNLVFSVMAIGGWLVASYSRMFVAIFRDVVLSLGAAIAMADWDGGAISAVALATFVVQIVYFFPSDGRFYLAAAPAFLAAITVKLRPGPAWVKAVVIASVAVADINGTASLASDYSAKRELRAEFNPAYAFIASKLPADAAILGSDAHIWLRTGHPVIGMPLPPEYFYITQDDAAVDQFFSRYKEIARGFGARYMILSPFGIGSEIVSDGPRERFFRSVRADPGLEPVFSSGAVELFKLR